MRSFLHTVQRNQMLMMTPNSLGRTGVIKSFIKHTTPLKVDSKVSWTQLIKLKCILKTWNQNLVFGGGANKWKYKSGDRAYSDAVKIKHLSTKY